LTHIHLGTALENRERFDDAIWCYHKAIELDHKQQSAYSNLERIMFITQCKDKGKIVKSIEFLERIVKKNCDNARAKETLKNLKNVLKEIKS
jgi:tetratricopeptide (TPR) repeat protein